MVDDFRANPAINAMGMERSRRIAPFVFGYPVEAKTELGFVFRAQVIAELGERFPEIS